MPLIEIRGRKVHVQEMGRNGPRVVLVHPLGSSLSAWFFTAAPLLARTFRVLLYDIRGHGLSDFETSGYDLATLTTDLLDVVETWAGDEPVRVGGHSSGGTMALRFGVDHPERVHSLAAVDAPMPPYPVRDNPVTAERDADEMLAGFPTEEVPVRAGSRRRALALNRQIRLRAETTFTSDFEAEKGFSEELRTMDRPTYLLYGTGSPFLDTGRELDALLPDSRLEIIRGGHRLPNQRRSAVAQRLGEFFA